jgi:hypothetical protein
MHPIEGVVSTSDGPEVRVEVSSVGGYAVVWVTYAELDAYRRGVTSYPPQPASPASDRTTTYGVIAIIGAICCVIIGVIFGILSYQEARKAGKQPTLAYIAFVLSALNLFGGIFWFSARN